MSRDKKVAFFVNPSPIFFIQIKSTYTLKDLGKFYINDSLKVSEVCSIEAGGDSVLFSGHSNGTIYGWDFRFKGVLYKFEEVQSNQSI